MEKPRPKDFLHLGLGALFLLLSSAWLLMGVVGSGPYHSTIALAWLASAALLSITLPFSFAGLAVFRAICVHAMYLFCVLFYVRCIIDIFRAYGSFYPGMMFLATTAATALNFWVGSNPRRWVYKYRNFVLYPSMATIAFASLLMGLIFFVGTLFSATLTIVAVLLSFAYTHDPN